MTMNLFRTWIGLIFLTSFGTGPIWSQALATDGPHTYKPILLKLDASGDKFVRFYTWHQMWVSQNWANAGTENADGQALHAYSDIGLRRTRFMAVGRISPRFSTVIHFGINNQSFISGKKPGLFFHDVFGEFALIPKKLSIGTGLHYFNGISRMASASTISFMALDASITNWTHFDQTDQFARQMGIFMHGQFGRFQFRAALNKPFSYGPKRSELVLSPDVQFIQNDQWATQGYLKWDFGDKEEDLLPFYAGTYLGRKKILNLGMGWYHHPNASALKHTPVLGDSIAVFDQLHLGLDAMVEWPVGKHFFHAYMVWQRQNYGPGYLKHGGVMNAYTAPVQAGNSISGGGHAYPTHGTGEFIYGQWGWGFPSFPWGHRVMPYLAIGYRDYERLSFPTSHYDFGVNYFINDHFAKVTLQYSLRPEVIYDQNIQPRSFGHQGQLILQTQIFL